MTGTVAFFVLVLQYRFCYLPVLISHAGAEEG